MRKKQTNENSIINYLKKKQLQGFILIPDVGMVALFNSKQSKAYVVDEIRTELQTIELMRERVASNRAMSLHTKEYKKTGTYIQ